MWEDFFSVLLWHKIKEWLCVLGGVAESRFFVRMVGSVNTVPDITQHGLRHTRTHTEGICLLMFVACV